MKAELTRAGFKNSYKQEIDKTVTKELGLNFTTIYAWKRELGQTMTNYSDNEKFEIVKKLMRMKSGHSEQFPIGNVNLAKPNHNINTPITNNCN
uniref:Transposase n=1 Tax=Globodera rostochiensis TaxID=31243 RepID=A0A914HNP3_GLORO